VRLVLDTSTAVSALLWRGIPGELIDAAQRKSLTLFSSAPLLAELRGVLSRQKFARQLEARNLVAEEIADGYAALVTIVTPALIRPTIFSDPSDDVVLATALGAQADLIVASDPHLLNLKTYQQIPIVEPAEMVKRLPQR